MFTPGSDLYKISMVVMDSNIIDLNKFRTILDSMLYSEEILIVFYNLGKDYFTYEELRKLMNLWFLNHPRIAFYGIEYDEKLYTPNDYLINIYESLKKDNYYLPKIFVTNNNLWQEDADKTGIFEKVILVDKINNVKNETIMNDYLNNGITWKNYVPHIMIDDLENIRATKNRKF
jgi:hypothetical protein